jgi:hypothetical protein
MLWDFLEWLLIKILARKPPIPIPIDSTEGFDRLTKHLLERLLAVEHRLDECESDRNELHAKCDELEGKIRELEKHAPPTS